MFIIVPVSEEEAEKKSRDSHKDISFLELMPGLTKICHKIPARIRNLWHSVLGHIGAAENSVT